MPCSIRARSWDFTEDISPESGGVSRVGHCSRGVAVCTGQVFTVLNPVHPPFLSHDPEFGVPPSCHPERGAAVEGSASGVLPGLKPVRRQVAPSRVARFDHSHFLLSSEGFQLFFPLKRCMDVFSRLEVNQPIDVVSSRMSRRRVDTVLVDASCQIRGQPNVDRSRSAVQNVDEVDFCLSHGCEGLEKQIPPRLRCVRDDRKFAASGWRRQETRCASVAAFMPQTHPRAASDTGAPSPTMK